MKASQITSALLLLAATSCNAFVNVNFNNQCLAERECKAVNSIGNYGHVSIGCKETALKMANDDDLLRWARSARSANSEDRVVELKRPLGLVLNQDDSGNVYVETVAPRGNAARTGMVKEGDIVTMCSATFGDQLWSTRGVGLTRVLSAIRVRAGPTVKLVFESPTENVKRAKVSAKNAKAAEDARQRAQAKRDQLLQELENDEKRLKKGKFLGLF